MPKPPKRAAKKTAAKKPAEAQSASEPVYTDSHGIRMMGNSVEVWTSCEAKMSRDYQSVGIQKGIRFTTPREDAEKAIEKATAIVRDAVRAEIDNFKEMIDGINDA